MQGEAVTEETVGTSVPVILLRVEDAATRLGIARTLMFRLIKDGEVESVRVGRLRRVPVASLEEYVERLRATQSTRGTAA